jgi:putative addiction module CopG family antidote
MNIKLNPEQEKNVKDELQSGRFRNVEEVIAEALQVLRERERLQSATKPNGQQREAVREMLAFVERSHTRLDGVSVKHIDRRRSRIGADARILRRSRHNGQGLYPHRKITGRSSFSYSEYCFCTISVPRPSSRTTVFAFSWC